MQRAFPCFEQGVALRHAARVGVFDDDYSRFLSGEFSCQFERGVGIV